MKKLLATAALATLIVSPAFAQKPPKHVAKPAVSVQASQTTPYGRTEGRVHSTSPAHDVYDNSHYVGSDPDSRIRFELLRDEGSTD
jgi:hypothetical protein